MSVWEFGSAGTLRGQAFWLPKKESSAEEYEDAFAVSENHSPDDDVPFRAALADGATESVFARRWAQLLADGFVSSGPAIFAEELPAAQTAWAEVARPQQTGTLPWYAAAKAADGAFATLLGLEVRREERAWQAAGVGDGNLFHLRASGDLACAWPRDEAVAFDDRPALLPSREDTPAPDPRRAEGAFEAGDAFVLATDAAAAWLLRTDPAEALRWDGEAAFHEAVHHARAKDLLKNDDTTVVTIRTA